LPLLVFRWVAGQKIDHIPGARTFQRQAIVAGARKALLQALEKEGVVTERLAEGREKILGRHQVHLVLHYCYYLVRATVADLQTAPFNVEDPRTKNQKKGKKKRNF
jgi:hypothetical protein